MIDDIDVDDVDDDVVDNDDDDNHCFFACDDIY